MQIKRRKFGATSCNVQLRKIITVAALMEILHFITKIKQKDVNEKIFLFYFFLLPHLSLWEVHA